MLSGRSHALDGNCRAPANPLCRAKPFRPAPPTVGSTIHAPAAHASILKVCILECKHTGRAAASKLHARLAYSGPGSLSGVSRNGGKDAEGWQLAGQLSLLSLLIPPACSPRCNCVAPCHSAAECTCWTAELHISAVHCTCGCTDCVSPIVRSRPHLWRQPTCRFCTPGCPAGSAREHCNLQMSP